MTLLRLLLARALFPKGGNLLQLAVWISIAGVALGIIQMVVVLSVFSGFQEFLQNHYIKVTSKIVVVPNRDAELPKKFIANIRSTSGVEQVAEFSIGQGMVLKQGVAGVVLEGIEVETSKKVTPWEDIWVEPPLKAIQNQNPHWIWLGVQLAKKLGVKVGESVRVLVVDGDSRRVIPFTVTALTRFGIYDHDLRYARIDLSVLKKIFGTERENPLFKLKLGENEEVPSVKQRLMDTVGYFARVKPWNEIHKNIFLAVAHQKQMFFLILEIIVALAAINVINLLLMSSHYRRRDIAILRAMGLRFSGVFLFFLAQGSFIGFVGILSGILGGYGTALVVEKFQPNLLAEAIYNTSQLPIKVELFDLLWIALVAMILCLVFSVLPAWRAARERPVTALRYE